MCSFSCDHGATSVIIGNCSLALAPVRRGKEKRMAEFLSYVEAIPMEVLNTVEVDWETIPQYMDRLDQHLGVNVGNLIGHTTVRYYVMDDDCQSRTATDDELKKMQAVVREGMEAGALGLSVSRNKGHYDPQGVHIPALWADEKEIFALADVLREMGTGIIQSGGGREAELSSGLMARLSEATGRPVVYNNLGQTVRRPDEWKQLMKRVDETTARARPFGRAARPGGGRIPAGNVGGRRPLARRREGRARLARGLARTHGRLVPLRADARPRRSRDRTRQGRARTGDADEHNADHDRGIDDPNYLQRYADLASAVDPDHPTAPTAVAVGHARTRRDDHPRRDRECARRVARVPRVPRVLGLAAHAPPSARSRRSAPRARRGRKHSNDSRPRVSNAGRRRPRSSSRCARRRHSARARPVRHSWVSRACTPPRCTRPIRRRPRTPTRPGRRSTRSRVRCGRPCRGRAACGPGGGQPRAGRNPRQATTPSRTTRRTTTSALSGEALDERGALEAEGAHVGVDVGRDLVDRDEQRELTGP